MKQIFTLSCAIFLLTFSPCLLADQVTLKGADPIGYHSANSDLVGPVPEGIAVRLKG